MARYSDVDLDGGSGVFLVAIVGGIAIASFVLAKIDVLTRENAGGFVKWASAVVAAVVILNIAQGATLSIGSAIAGLAGFFVTWGLCALGLHLGVSIGLDTHDKGR